MRIGIDELVCEDGKSTAAECKQEPDHENISEQAEPRATHSDPWVKVYLSVLRCHVLLQENPQRNKGPQQEPCSKKQETQETKQDANTESCKKMFEKSGTIVISATKIRHSLFKRLGGWKTRLTKCRCKYKSHNMTSVQLFVANLRRAEQNPHQPETNGEPE